MLVFLFVDCAIVNTFYFILYFITLGSYSGVPVRLASGQDSYSEEPGRLTALRKWRTGGAARHDRRFVAGYLRTEREFAYQIP